MNEPSRIYVITGPGKGKTTTALGYALKGVWLKQKSVVIQFLKGGGYTGELVSADRLFPWLKIYQFGHGCPIAAEIRSGEKLCNSCGLCFRENRNPKHGYAQLAMAKAWQVMTNQEAQWILLDEISHAVRHGLLDEQEVLRYIDLKPDHVNLVLTGRNMSEAILGKANCITQCEALKHPMTKGIAARRGSEY